MSQSCWREQINADIEHHKYLLDNQKREEQREIYAIIKERNRSAKELEVPVDTFMDYYG